MSRTRKSDHSYAINALRIVIPNLFTFLAILAAVPVWGQEPAKPASRAEAVAIIANARKIVTPRGGGAVAEGADRRDRSMGLDSRRRPQKSRAAIHHGGPGYVSIPMSWWFSRGLEEYFTIIQWDQRATGKTYLLSVLPRSHPLRPADRGEGGRCSSVNQEFLLVR
jgi:proline iminopeptidase